MHSVEKLKEGMFKMAMKKKMPVGMMKPAQKKAATMQGAPAFKKGGSIDGVAIRGKTKGKDITMKKGGRCG